MGQADCKLDLFLSFCILILLALAICQICLLVFPGILIVHISVNSDTKWKKTDPDEKRLSRRQTKPISAAPWSWYTIKQCLVAIEKHMDGL